MAAKGKLLDELRAKRDALKRRYASSEEAIQKKEMKLETLRQERMGMERETVGLSRAVGSLIDKIGRVRRSVVKKRLI